MRRRRRNNDAQDKGFASQILGLSLFIMLLAFFMVLNAISSYEKEKSRNIMESLEYAFSSKITQRGDINPSVTKSAEKSIYDGDTIDRIDALFRAQIPGYKHTINRRRGIMHVAVTRKEFEGAVYALGQRAAPPGTTEKSEFKNYFLPTLVTMLRSDDKGQPFRLEITYNVAENPARMQRLRPQDLEKTTHAVNLMAAEIEKAGLPARMIESGVQKGDADMVDLYFVRYTRFDVSKALGAAAPNAEGEGAP